ncbi:MAG TPA: CPBP family intramembrane metalloprotease [Tessaracoccus flavescens]|uniref:CPBP family intramembrane metalloprotease n=1 Tax=Tessaracoccus flavescens TaxID=399497 RepID=A0A921JQ41_9ACTN|nr:CPBP family intramembrane metalloprotease [Tessaracoccus flavescens]
MSLLAVGPTADPAGGLTYPEALRRPGFYPFHSMFGILVAFSGFVILTQIVNVGVLWVGRLIRGGEWDTYVEQATSYRLLDGPLAGNLALASLIPLSMLIVRVLHKVHPRWLASVQPGVRWRYLLLSIAVALVALNGVLWLSFLAKGVPVFHSGQEGWPAFAVAILLTSPLQAAAEEVFFRGYLMQAIGSATGRAWVGVVGSAVLFALLHGAQNPALFAHRLAFGLIAGALVVATGGLEAAIGAHIVNNLAAYGYAMFTSSIAELKAVEAISWADAGWDIAGFTVFAVAAWWLGRRLKVATRTP